MRVEVKSGVEQDFPLSELKAGEHGVITKIRFDYSCWKVGDVVYRGIQSEHNNYASNYRDGTFSKLDSNYYFRRLRPGEQIVLTA